MKPVARLPRKLRIKHIQDGLVLKHIELAGQHLIRFGQGVEILFGKYLRIAAAQWASRYDKSYC